MNATHSDNTEYKNSVVIIDAQYFLQDALDCFSASAPWVTWYFGRHYDTFLQVQNRMPEMWTCANVGVALDEAAGRILKSVANIENTQFNDKSDRTWWDASDLGDRGPFVTQFLEGAAQSQVIDDALHSGGLNIFVIEDIEFAHILYRNLVQKGVKVGWKRPNGRWCLADYVRETSSLMKRVVLSVRAILSGVRHTFRLLLANRKARTKVPLDLEKLRACDVLLCIWAGKNVFPEKGPLKRDTYFGRLPALLREQGYTVGYIACPVIGDGTHQQIVANTMGSQEPIISIEDCLSPAKILKAALGAFIAPWRISINVKLDGVDLEPTLRLERQREMQTWRPMLSRFFWHIGETLARNEIRPLSIVHLYENQPWEKILRAGLRRVLPETKIIGYQHVPLPPYFINTFPSTREIKQGLIPDHILVPGERFMASLREWGMPSERLSVAGGLRFENLSGQDGQVDRILDPSARRQKKPLTILCCTSIDFEKTLELVYKVSVVQLRTNNFHMLVNFHPAFPETSRVRLKALIVDLLHGAEIDQEYSEAKVHDVLPDADLVAYNNSSSAYDALASKCPTLFVLSDTTLDYDRVPTGLSYRIRSVEELSDFVNNFVNGNVHMPCFEDLNKAISQVDVSAFKAAIPSSLNN